MKQRNDLDRISQVDLPVEIQLPEGPKSLWSTAGGYMPPISLAILGVFSFLTCGAAVVATAAMVALHIQ